MTGERGRRRISGALLAAVLLAPLALAGCSGEEPKRPKPTRTPTLVEDRLVFGVYGTSAEVEPFDAVVESFNQEYDGTEVSLRGYGNHDDLLDAVIEGESGAPDVFMISRDDLGRLIESETIRPVDEPLVQRGMDFGDDYSRDAILAMSGDNHLLCMPYGITPMVIFYNRALVDFADLAERGKPVPNEGELSWGLEATRAAAVRASRPKTGARGIYIEPSITGLAPFIYSGGGDVFDDQTEPTSLAFSESGSQAALEQTLELLRNPHLTLSDIQLAKRTPLEWFQRGKLAMIAGYRDLVPALREVPGLDFDVIAMPSLGAQRTVGDITGLCIRRDALEPSVAADFVFHAVSDREVAEVARAGYLVPANLSIANSEDFLQSGRDPEHAQVFNNAAKSIVPIPLVQDFAALEEAVSGLLREMLTTPVIDLAELTARIDLESRTVLSPETLEPSEGPTLSPSDSASPTGGG